MPSSLTEISKTLGISLRLLAKLKADGVIGETVEDIEIPRFKFLSQILCNPKYIRMQIEEFSIKEQKELLKPKPFTPMDKYIMGRYRNLNSSEKLSVTILSIELWKRFGVSINDKLRSRIIKLRGVVRAERKGDR